MNQTKINPFDLSFIEVQALFLQYKEGDREAIDRELLYAMIDILQDALRGKK